MENKFDAYFDRFDICEAHLLFEWHYNMGGIVRERPSNSRRNMSTDFQLNRMGFRSAPNLTYATLSINGKRIYNNLVNHYFPTNPAAI